MPIVCTELDEVAPGKPIALCVVGDYVMVVSENVASPGLMPNGSFAVMRGSTSTAKAFSGLEPYGGTYGNFTWGCCAAAYGFAFTFHGAGQMAKIDVATGGMATWATRGGSGSARSKVLGGAGGYAVLADFFEPPYNNYKLNCWHVSTDAKSIYSFSGTTWKTWFSTGTHIYGSDYLTWFQFDPSTGTKVDLGWAPANYAICPGAFDGTYGWYSTNSSFVRVDLTSGSQVSWNHSSIPGGGVLPGSSMALHSDGWIYGVTDGDHIVGLNRSNGDMGKAPLAPTRGRRGAGVASAGGKLWIPSGEPLS